MLPVTAGIRILTNQTSNEVMTIIGKLLIKKPKQNTATDSRITSFPKSNEGINVVKR